jgi:GTP-binding protein
LRESFDIPGVPVRMSIHASDNPYASRAKSRK